VKRQSIDGSIFKEFNYCTTPPSTRWLIIVIVLMVIIGVGLYTFILQGVKGHVITGMRDYVVWGVYITNFIYFLGISYACAMISCFFHLTRIQWGKSLMRILELIAFITIIIAPVYILLCIGRIDRLHFLAFHGRIQSPIIWDVIAIVTDIIFCMVYLFLSYVKDFARLRDYTAKLDIADWKKKLYRKLALGYAFEHEQEKRLSSAMDIMAAIIIPTSIVAYSLLAWLFGMNLRPGWHSSIFGPQFILNAVYSGVAIIIIIMWFYRRILKLEKYITDNHFYFLGYGLLILTLFFGYFVFSDFITNWYNTQKTTSILLQKLLDNSQYGIMYKGSLFITLFLTIVVIGIPQLRTVNSIFLVSVLVMLALWINRYLMIVPVLETTYIPISDPRPEYIKYDPTIVEWILTVTGLAVFMLFLMIMTKLAPVIPVSALEEKSTFKLFGKFSFKDHSK